MDEIRYEIEHRRLPQRFFCAKKEFTDELVSDESLFSFYDLLYDIMGGECPYKEEQFKVRRTNQGNGVWMIAFTLPEPEEVLQCSKIILIYDRKYKNMGYFTVELSKEKTAFLCEWHEKGMHINHGKISNSLLEVEKQVLEIYTSRRLYNHICKKDNTEGSGLDE